MKPLDNKRVNSLKEIREHVVDCNKESILTILNQIVRDVVIDDEYGVFINTGFKWGDVLNTEGTLVAIDEFRELPEYETEIISENGVEYLAIKVLPIEEGNEWEVK